MNRKPRRSVKQDGMTLIEILLVLLILLMIGGSLVVFLLPQAEGARINTTRIKLRQIAGAIDTYNLQIGRPPSEAEGLQALVTRPEYENEALRARWNGPYLDPSISLTDAWEHSLRYEPTDLTFGEESSGGRKYRLYSVGPDGQPDTEDDIRLDNGQDGGGSVG